MYNSIFYRVVSNRLERFAIFFSKIPQFLHSQVLWATGRLEVFTSIELGKRMRQFHLIHSIRVGKQMNFLHFSQLNGQKHEQKNDQFPFRFHGKPLF